MFNVAECSVCVGKNRYIRGCSVKSFERFYGLDAALHKNISFLLSRQIKQNSIDEDDAKLNFFLRGLIRSR